eukprot:TRINITY_DN9910_c3_g1_i1.p1 TRINITY_DN9910_c3_g1~~TRINITY_DN9910_c3_g1_i1.p1  ORF type:complete len:611 (+),score=86.15 TRINITY_DN9910_c3_g1_i1:332-2164(+)
MSGEAANATSPSLSVHSCGSQNPLTVPQDPSARSPAAAPHFGDDWEAGNSGGSSTGSDSVGERGDAQRVRARSPRIEINDRCIDAAGLRRVKSLGSRPSTNMTEFSVHINDGIRSSVASSAMGGARRSCATTHRTSELSRCSTMTPRLTATASISLTQRPNMQRRCSSTSSADLEERVHHSPPPAASPPPPTHPLRRVTLDSSPTITDLLTLTAVSSSTASDLPTRSNNRLERWFLDRSIPLKLKFIVCVAPLVVFAVSLLTLVCVRADSVVGGVFLGLFVLVAAATIPSIRYVAIAVGEQQYHLALELQRRMEVEACLARFIPAEFLMLLNLRNISDIEAGVRNNSFISVMFTDVRGFSDLTDGLSSDQIFHWLARLTAEVTPIVRKNAGFIDKYLGDGVMAIFREPGRALQAAIGLQTQVDVMNESVAEKQRIRMGIGVHYGEVCVGTVGDTERLDTTIISNVVNLASRFESLTKYYGARILVSDAVLTRSMDTGVAMRSVGRVMVKGSSQVHELFDIFQTDPSRQRALKQETSQQFAMALRKYEEQDWQEATRLWKACLHYERLHYAAASKERLDRAVQTKIFFCRRYKEHGVPIADWRGVDCWTLK